MIDLSDEQKKYIDNQIDSSDDIQPDMKRKQRKFLRVLFWLGNTLKDRGCSEQFIRAHIPLESPKIKIADDRWDYASKVAERLYIKYQKKYLSTQIF